jgi:hypothetical protein
MILRDLIVRHNQLDSSVCSAQPAVSVSGTAEGGCLTGNTTLMHITSMICALILPPTWRSGL